MAQVNLDLAKESTSQEILWKLNNMGGGTYFMEYIFDCEIKEYSTGFFDECICVVDDVLYMAGDSSTIKKWDGETLTTLPSLSAFVGYGVLCVYNGELHWLGGNINTKRHYKLSNETGKWVSVSTPKCVIMHGGVIVHDGVIHVFSEDKVYYTWDGSEWTKQTSTTILAQDGYMFIKDDVIHCAKGTKVYKFVGGDFVEITGITLPSSVSGSGGNTWFYNGTLYQYCRTANSSGLYKWSGDNELVKILGYSTSDWDTFFVYKGCFYLMNQVDSDTGTCNLIQLTSPYIEGYMIKGTRIYSDYLRLTDNDINYRVTNVEFVSDDCAVVLENGNTIVEFTVSDPTYVIA